MRTIRTFSGDTTTPALARRWLARHLPESAPEPERDTALLLVSELVTNSVAHARTPCTLAAEIAPDRLCVAVADRSGRRPFVASRGATSDSGRGLVLVSRLARDWGWLPISSGKLVWFELPLPGSGQGGEQGVDQAVDGVDARHHVD